MDIVVGPYWSKRPISNYLDLDFGTISQGRITGPHGWVWSLGFPLANLRSYHSLLLLFISLGFGLLEKQLSYSTDRGEYRHHNNGSKAPRSSHFMMCSTLEVMVLGMMIDMS